jgi:hypothetical protein
MMKLTFDNIEFLSHNPKMAYLKFKLTNSITGVTFPISLVELRQVKNNIESFIRNNANFIFKFDIEIDNQQYNDLCYLLSECDNDEIFESFTKNDKIFRYYTTESKGEYITEEYLLNYTSFRK